MARKGIVLWEKTRVDRLSDGLVIRRFVALRSDGKVVVKNQSLEGGKTKYDWGWKIANLTMQQRAKDGKIADWLASLQFS